MSDSIRDTVLSHSGEFLCEEIHRPENTKTVKFRHVASPPGEASELPDIQGLRQFYEEFGSLSMYVDDESGDTAYHVAEPSRWAGLDGDFSPWIEDLDDDTAEWMPAWIDTRIVVGESPLSGNYLLVPSEGPDAGKVFEFEHDGFEFIELAESLPDFALKSLRPDAGTLTAMASHLRFTSGEPDGECRQWWILEMRDNLGNVVRTGT